MRWFRFLIVISVAFYGESFSTRNRTLCYRNSQNIVHETSVTVWPSRKGSYSFFDVARTVDPWPHRHHTCYYFIWSHFTLLFRLCTNSVTLLHPLHINIRIQSFKVSKQRTHSFNIRFGPLSTQKKGTKIFSSIEKCLQSFSTKKTVMTTTTTTFTTIGKSA